MDYNWLVGTADAAYMTRRQIVEVIEVQVGSLTADIVLVAAVAVDWDNRRLHAGREVERRACSGMSVQDSALIKTSE